MSRITGYIGDLSGWNNAKRAEIRDRVRYDPFDLAAVPAPAPAKVPPPPVHTPPAPIEVAD